MTSLILSAVPQTCLPLETISCHILPSATCSSRSISCKLTLKPAISLQQACGKSNLLSQQNRSFTGSTFGNTNTSHGVQKITCSAGGGARQGEKVLKVVVNGAGSELGRAVIRAVNSARGMQLAGAIDSDPAIAGVDAGELAGIAEGLEMPVMSDLVMVLASIAQSRAVGVYVDVTGSSNMFENIRQATAFGLSTVVGGSTLPEDELNTLVEFCEKASTGCLVAPELSVGTLLLRQAAEAAAFHYAHVDIFESHSGPAEALYPRRSTAQLADTLSELGRTFNSADFDTSHAARGAVTEEGVRVHSSRHPGVLSSLEARFASAGEVWSVKHDVTDVRALMPGLLLAIRKVVRLRTLVLGLEKIL